MKPFCTLCIAGGLLLTPQVMQADPDQDFEYSSDGRKVVITGYVGAGGAVVIPSSIMILWNPTDKGAFWTMWRIDRNITFAASVKSIDKRAFEGCTNLTRVTIPGSVTSIGKQAFLGCDRLTSIVVDSNNPNYSDRSGVLYNKHGDKLICYPAGKVDCQYEIPSRVTSIGENAFAGCTHLTNVTIPSRVTSIGENAFAGCTHLTNVTIPASVTSIGEEAFAGCTNLTNVTIPASVTNIGDNAFDCCDRVTDISVDLHNPNYSDRSGVLFDKCASKLIYYPAGKMANRYVIAQGVISIGETALAPCKHVTNVAIPSTVTNIGRNAFCQFGRLTDIVVDSHNPKYSDQNGILFDKCASKLICYPAGRVDSRYVIPQYVINIGEDAFAGCTHLTNVTIPGSVTSIGEGAFFRCRNLTNVTITNSVTNMGKYVFLFCDNLTNVTISRQPH